MNSIPKWVLVVGLTLAALLALNYVAVPPGEQTAAEAVLSYDQFRGFLEKGEIATIHLRGDDIRGTFKNDQIVPPIDTPISRFSTRVPAFGDPDLLPLIFSHGVKLSVIEDEPGGQGLIYAMVPWLLMLGLFWLFWSRLAHNLPGGVGRAGDVTGFLEGSARKEEKGRKKVTFADVAGLDNAKREVSELVDYLRDPDRFTRLGAEVPHGVLLMGPPGTGKTLLARALAGESEVPFFHISASEFIELFVGVGASRVRRMFDEAKKRAPSIIFIDELDSVGRVRGTGLGGGHDEREQTLNQILAEMDGFSGHEAVIVLAATNRPDVLDAALLRPGRFDRHVTLDLPDKTARRDILRVHTRKIPLAGDVDLATLAAGTPGFSGADLKNLVNEAAILAAREGATEVDAGHFEQMRDKLLMGSVRTLAIQPEERHRLAVHESGHAVLAFNLPTADPLHKVSIIPRGRALGVTQQLPEEDRHTLPEEYLLDRLVIMMGGRTAERLLLGSRSSGADDDIHQATLLARAMVGRWGMSEDVGPVDVRESDAHPFLGREIALPRHFSEATAEAVDDAVRKLLKEAETRAAEIIEQNRPQLDRLVAALEARESLDQADLEVILGGAENAVLAQSA
ncbi:MAG: ATP-dependent zinc metalloprotease FtsH [Alphaproteobacteria bacterium]|nr:ATP-dependent zinc metalloprotease FtsH [Alphaproteobacteria bacterium]